MRLTSVAHLHPRHNLIDSNLGPALTVFEWSTLAAACPAVRREGRWKLRPTEGVPGNVDLGVDGTIFFTVGGGYYADGHTWQRNYL
ncbi:MAG: hypothetical protein ACN4G0_06050 [Polyangiales bacterium]